MTSRAADPVRWIVVVLSTVFAVVASFIGSGAAGGTPIAEASGGALDTDSTMVAPAGPAFAIWSVLYVGFVAYAIWQFFPTQRHAPRQRRLGFVFAVTMVLNGAWILSIQADWLAASVVVIILLLASLLWLFRLSFAPPPSGRTDAIITDVTVGLYLGWVCVATAANIAAFLAASGFTGWGIAPEVWGAVVVVVAAAAAVSLSVWSGGRASPAVAVAWGLGWIAVSRVTGGLESIPVAVVAGVCVLVVLAFAVIRKGLRRSPRAASAWSSH